jgi:hypothetical protein
MRLAKTVGLIVLALIHLGIVITMAEVGYDRMHLLYFGKSGFAAEAVYRIPRTYEEIVVERRAAHLFLAEYDRELIFRIGDREFARKTAAADSGGYCRMKVFRISPTHYFLCGELSKDAYIVDVSGRSIRNASDKDRFSEATYIGVFDNDENGPWQFIAANHRAEQGDKLIGSACSRHIDEGNHRAVAGTPH